MSDFLVSVFRGLYPPFLLFLVWGAAVRIRSRQWTCFDTLLLAAFLVFEFLAVWFFYGVFQTSRRYLWMAVPLSLPFAARGVADIGRRLKSFPRGRDAFHLFLLVFAAASVCNFYTPVLRGYLPGKKRQERLISFRAARWIAEDWKRSAHPFPLKLVKCDQYQSGRHPLVRSPFSRVGYLCGGQRWPEFFLRAGGIAPEYIVGTAPGCPEGYHLAVRLEPGVYIYRFKFKGKMR